MIVLADRALDEQAWKDARRTVVTASEVCHLMRSADARWLLEPDALAAEKRSNKPRVVGDLAKAGTFWEPHIASYLSACSGLVVEQDSRLLGNPKLPFMACSPDAFLFARQGTQSPLSGLLEVYLGGECLHDEEAVQGLLEAIAKSPRGAIAEFKNQASKDRWKWNKPGSPPAYYYSQVQHQLTVLELDIGLLVAKVDANELHVHVIERDEFYCELLVETCREFWEKYLRE